MNGLLLLHYIVNGVAKEINLGMVPIHGSATALNIQKLVSFLLIIFGLFLILFLQQYEAKLKDFGLDPVKHIVGTSGDGASAMVAFGDGIESEYVQCNDHGIHLGVTKVLYLKKKPVKPPQEQEAPEEDEASWVDDDDDDDLFFVECGSEDELEEDEPDVNDEVESDSGDVEEDSVPMVFDYQPTISKLRRIVSLFHRSSVKNEILQKFVKKMNDGRELKLKMDSKTRWGSLHDACERFLKLLEPVKAALNHKEIDKGVLWTEIDSKRLKELVDVLHPAKMAVQFLSKKSVNLIDCNTTINFLLNNLKEQPHQLSQDIYIAIKDKIHKRRHDVLQSLILYLHDHESINVRNNFVTSSVAAMTRLAVKMMERLFSSEDDDCSLQPEEPEDQPSTSSTQRSLAEQLEFALNASRKVNNKQPITVDYKKEMQSYAKTKVRSLTLDRLLDGLLTIQATSVAAERRFSEANLLVSKVRNRLCDENIDAISFLKCYFRNKVV